MTPKPQEFLNDGNGEKKGLSPDAVVISGMAGMYPKSYNVKEFREKLYNKENTIATSTRWKYNHPEVAKCTGKVPDLEYFDANFFKIHYRLAQSMDSMSKKALEQTFDAIYDAGICPDELSGTKVGVYFGTCFSETEKACFYVATSRTGFGIAGCSKSMFANRVSYWLNAKGPSMSIDQACCSSNVSLELAYQALKRGDIDSAVVAGSNLCLHPQSTVHYGRIINLSKDGITKSFDKNGHGCAKSEAINVLFLQRAKDALRVYAEVVHAKSEFFTLLADETGPKFTFYREPGAMAGFLENFYDEANVAPEAVEYVEAVGSASPEVDRAELEALGKVFCTKRREEPLLVGSVMSNLGYVEAATGIAAVTKVLLGYESGKLAANINCDNPIDDIDSIRDGKMTIVREHEPFGRGYTAVSGLSVTGINSHILLKGHHKQKDLLRYKCNLPYLVNVSGRQKSAVERVFEDLKKRPIDPEEIALFHNIHKSAIRGHLGKGYILLDTDEDNKTVVISQKADHSDDVKRPLWFVYSGMGSQWAGMGKELMRIPIFAAAIEKCKKALEPKGIDIVHIITSPDKTIFDNILHSFVGIAAVQIGLTDVLKEMDIIPDKIIGHSVGELGCAYADGCLTAEEMILSAYSRGLVSVQTPFIRGSMAAVGIGYEQVVKLCPPEIEVACHNSSESSTISGPAEVMKQFVESLTAKGVFAKEVPCSNIAYHSRYIAEAGPGLLKYLNEVIKTPRLRSDRWVSTSIPEDRWGEPLAKYSSAEYHTNNLLCPVLFEETSAKHIPKNAVLVEVAPHGLLQAILKRSLPNCVNIPLTRRGHADNVKFLLEATGKIYMEGYYPKVQALYPKIQFPVSTGTPMLSHLIEWAHNEKWTLPLYVSAHRKTAALCNFVMSVQDDEYNYLCGHVIRDQNLYPFSAVLVAVWDTLAMTLGYQKKSISVNFEHVRFFAQPVLYKKQQLVLTVAIQRGTGKFEVSNDGGVVATGSIHANEKKECDRLFYEKCDQNYKECLESADIYKLLYARGYQYGGAFRNLQSVNTSLTEAKISWDNNWVTFIEGLLQLHFLRQQGSLSQLDSIRKITIDINQHLMKLNDSVLNAEILDVHDCTRCGGILLQKVALRDIPVLPSDNGVAIDKIEFIPHFGYNQTDEYKSLYVYLQILAENVIKDKINAIEILENQSGNSSYTKLNEVMVNLPKLTVNYKAIYQDFIGEEKLLQINDVVFISHLSNNEKILKHFNNHLPRNTFIINKEYTEESKMKPSSLYAVLCSHNIGNETIQLIRWRPESISAGTSALTIHSESDLRNLISTLNFLPSNQKILIISSYPPIPKLTDFVKIWKKEGRNVNLIMINHEIDKEQFVDDFPNSDLVFNLLDHGTWGGQYYVPVNISQHSNQETMLQSINIGDINSFEWVESNVDLNNENERNIYVKVHYAAINERDVKRAAGVIKFPEHNNQSYYGMDFSGVTDSGCRVMGIVDGGSVRSRVKTNPNLLWPVPENWNLEDAATVPLAYCMAFHCLDMSNRFIPDKTVILIHGACGALGQAAISISLAYNFEVFATVSERSKKHFLKKLFPELKEENIGYSRDDTFGDMVLSQTKGRGCDIVISCVRGNLKNISLKCCGKMSIVLDTAQLQDNEEYTFGMFYLTKERAYKLVDFASVFDPINSEYHKRLQVLVSEGIARGYVRPLTRVVYAPEHAARAFRLLAASRHRGRVLIDMHTHSILSRRTKISYTANNCHLVLSDNDVMAVEFSNRLIERGVRKLLLVVPEKTAFISFKQRSWENAGVYVDLLSPDSWNKNKITDLLKNAINLEGLYAIVTNHDQYDNVNEFLVHLDLKTREFCSDLRYFTIINNDNDIGERVILNRRKNRLPATLVKLPPLRMNDNDVCERAVPIQCAIDGIEEAVISQEAVLLVHISTSSTSFLECISTWAGIDLNKEKDTETLEELGVDKARLQTVQACLRDKYNLWYNENDVASLNVKRIREIEDKILDADYKPLEGLSSFYTNVDSDELLATTEMTFLSTLTNSATMREDEFDPGKAYLCIIPGVEGHHLRFQEMCQRLKLAALVLQPEIERNESIHDTAQRFAKTMLNRTELKKNFYLLGFEAGVMIALEMAAILENKGLTGVVYCVGGSPREIQAEFNEKLKNFKDEVSLQEAVGRHMVKLMAGNSTDSLEQAFKQASSWQEIVNCCVRDVIGRVKQSNQYTRELIVSAYSRIIEVKKYVPKSVKLRSLLVLIRANLESEEAMKVDDHMQNYSEQPIVKYQLSAPLVHAPKDLKCPSIINRHLDNSLLEEFKERNLCETYLLNADTFMTSAVQLED